MSDTLVRVSDIHKTYTRGEERIDVLQGLSLEIPSGDFLALMGPSGSGKSTLLNLIGGHDRPTSGAIEVEGQRIDQLSDGRLAAWRARHVGFVFQMYNLLPAMTAERNIELPLLGRSRPPIRFSSVDLPEPDGPISARKSLSRMSRSSFSSTCTVSTPRL